MHCHGGVQTVHGFATNLVNQVGIRRTRAHKYWIEAEFACGSDGANGFTDDGAQHHHVAAAGLQLGNLRRKVGSASLVAGLFGEFHIHGFKARLTATQDLQTKVIVLVHGADFFCAFFLNQGWQGDAHLVIVGGGERVFKAVQRLVHFARGSDREKVDYIFFELHRHGCQILCGTDVTRHDENFVLVHQLLRCQHRFFGVVTIVLYQQFELAAVDTALLIDLGHRQLHARARLLAKAG